VQFRLKLKCVKGYLINCKLNVASESHSMSPSDLRPLSPILLDLINFSLTFIYTLFVYFFSEMIQFFKENVKFHKFQIKNDG